MVDDIELLDNVEYNISNPLTKENTEIMLSASLISLDVDPHDGIQEKDFVNFFVDNNWKGLMVCDDIEEKIEMKRFWQNVSKTKYDISYTRYSHYSGTGIICFDDQSIILNDS